MGYKAISVNHDGIDLFIAFAREENDLVSGATLHTSILTSKSKPSTTPEVLALIKTNSFKSFNLYKVENGALVLRTVSELQSSIWLDVSTVIFGVSKTIVAGA